MKTPRHEYLDFYREKAHQYYQSPEYRGRVFELQEIIRSVGDRLARLRIAVDLEGTLTSLNLRVHCENNGFDSLDRLRRPLANEMLAVLAASSKHTMVWSSAPPERFQGVIGSSRLKIPGRVSRVHRRQYIRRLSPFFPVLSRFSEAFPDSSECSHALDQLLQCGTPKIPFFMRVDFLLDDYAHKDRPLLERLYPDEVRKLLRVPPFTLDTRQQLAHHHFDTGLLDACRGLAERVKADPG